MRRMLGQVPFGSGGARQREEAFTMGRGLYHVNVMLMGLTNAPATCRRLVGTVLRGLPWKTCALG